MPPRTAQTQKLIPAGRSCHRDYPKPHAIASVQSPSVTQSVPPRALEAFPTCLAKVIFARTLQFFLGLQAQRDCPASSQPIPYFRRAKPSGPVRKSCPSGGSHTVYGWLPGQLKGSEGGRCGLLEKVKVTTVWVRARWGDWIVCVFSHLKKGNVPQHVLTAGPSTAILNLLNAVTPEYNSSYYVPKIALESTYFLPPIGFGW